MPDIQIPGIVVNILQVILAFSGAFGVALWLSLIVWTFRDARSRSRDAFAIMLATLMTVIFGPLGVLLYFLLRPPVTLAELYERSLEEEALLQDLEERLRCPGCSRMVDDAWIVCPDCHTQLKQVCRHCNHNLHLRWNICPYCGTGINQTGTPETRQSADLPTTPVTMATIAQHKIKPVTSPRLIPRPENGPSSADNDTPGTDHPAA